MITRVCLSWLDLEENKKRQLNILYFLRDRTVMFTV